MFAFFAAHVVSVNHRAFDGGGRIAFVLEKDGLAESVGDLLRLFKGVLRLRPRFPVGLKKLAAAAASPAVSAAEKKQDDNPAAVISATAAALS